MDYNSELQRLRRLLRADHQAYLHELDRPWPGMGDDLELAARILLKHAATAGGRLRLLEACDIPEDPEAAATVTLPEWWSEIVATFAGLYEPAEAEYRTQKVLNELIGKQLGQAEPVTCH